MSRTIVSENSLKNGLYLFFFFSSHSRHVHSSVNNEHISCRTVYTPRFSVTLVLLCDYDDRFTNYNRFRVSYRNRLFLFSNILLETTTI